MDRQLWGCYAVDDHKQARPFVADVLLFERLVIPVQPEGKMFNQRSRHSPSGIDGRFRSIWLQGHTVGIKWNMKRHDLQGALASPWPRLETDICGISPHMRRK
jgi:hypothetical protein